VPSDDAIIPTDAASSLLPVDLSSLPSSLPDSARPSQAPSRVGSPPPSRGASDTSQPSSPGGIEDFESDAGGDVAAGGGGIGGGASGSSCRRRKSASSHRGGGGGGGGGEQRGTNGGAAVAARAQLTPPAANADASDADASERGQRARGGGSRGGGGEGTADDNGSGGERGGDGGQPTDEPPLSSESLIKGAAEALQRSGYAETLGSLEERQMVELRESSRKLLLLELFVMVMGNVAGRLPRYVAALELHTNLAGKAGAAGTADVSTMKLAVSALRSALKMASLVKRDAKDMAKKLDRFVDDEAPL
jgi:hypothetical protein